MYSGSMMAPTSRTSPPRTSGPSWSSPSSSVCLRLSTAEPAASVSAAPTSGRLRAMGTVMPRRFRMVPRAAQMASALSKYSAWPPSSMYIAPVRFSSSTSGSRPKKPMVATMKKHTTEVCSEPRSASSGHSIVATSCASKAFMPKTSASVASSAHSPRRTPRRLALISSTRSSPRHMASTPAVTSRPKASAQVDDHSSSRSTVPARGIVTGRNTRPW
mmetsp:Transcript_43993/g.138271  ORF Transcript_43993/g.138271 Transcript_43993/m.138271 type:complete len:217 (+) Transcript_43993:1138-1788(+)